MADEQVEKDDSNTSPTPTTMSPTEIINIVKSTINEHFKEPTFPKQTCPTVPSILDEIGG